MKPNNSPRDKFNEYYDAAINDILMLKILNHKIGFGKI